MFPSQGHDKAKIKQEALLLQRNRVTRHVCKFMLRFTRYES